MPVARRIGRGPGASQPAQLLSLETPGPLSILPLGTGKGYLSDCCTGLAKSRVDARAVVWLRLRDRSVMVAGFVVYAVGLQSVRLNATAGKYSVWEMTVYEL